MKILHISNDDKFMGEFISHVNSNFDINCHTFFVIGRKWRYDIENSNNVIKVNNKFPSRYLWLPRLIKLIYKCDKVVIHGLFNRTVINILAISPSIASKSNWFLWGADLYKYLYRNDSVKNKAREFMRRRAIKNISEISTYIKGDYDLVRHWYGSKAVLKESLLYKSNIIDAFGVEQDEKSVEKNTSKKVLVGNSGDTTNRHEYAFELINSTGDAFDLICPLSYGKKDYIERIHKLGIDTFGNNFTPIVNFLDKSDYYTLLDSVDYGLFLHKRQQAMGNIIYLLYRGKSVYLSEETTHFAFFIDLGVKVFKLEDFGKLRLNDNEVEKNIELIKDYFSVKNYNEQLTKIFSD